MFEDYIDERALPEHRVQDHEILLLEGRELVYQPLRRISENDLRTLKLFIDKQIKRGFIQKLALPIGSSILLVLKLDSSKRLYIDYRQLNNIIVKDQYILLRADDLRDILRGIVIFTQLDLCKGYHLVYIRDREEQKTTFYTLEGHYKYIVIQEGLTNVLAIFQRLINDILR